MTVTTSAPSSGGQAPVPPEDLVTLTIDGIEISVPKGTLVIRAAEQLGIEIPRFCDHPSLDPAGACRQCIVEVEGQRKPMASCTITCTDGMVVKTQLTSPVAEKAQKGVMELLLINHPLDCPVCDKGGECPLQNQAMSHGQAESRFEGRKRTYEKPVPISTQVLLDRERCVLCARCTRFSNQIAGDPMIELIERGALQQVGTGEGDPFESYFSGNTIQICPVGALTSAAYRFRSRPFDLVSSPSVCEHCSGGCATRTDHRRGKVMRRLAANDPEVNEEWICDKGRFAFRYAQQRDRLTTPLVRNAEGELERRRGPRRFRSPRRDCSPPAVAPVSSPAAGSPSRTPTRTASSRGWRSTPTTSTSARACTAARRPTSSPPGSPAAVSTSTARASRTPCWRRPRRCCSSGSSPRRRHPASSCGCARRGASTGRRCTRWPRTPRAA
ncbi:hypothetical protein GCM10020256_31230 [Streptomyces thermocoprophilus]